MTTLGQAYVQIMPSAKGISGSIQSTINPEATAAGKSAGKNIASSIADSLSKSGKLLTKSITVPALGAATAVGGIVAALGWGRLTGLDSARAQLQGLGYDAEAVDRISGLVNESIQGTVTTMAEGVSIAAGGLAAGVEEGEELERYIKLVGDAAVGANRDVGDMAQIFNRVQGSGKLMTQELNMIEDGMPGFAMAMADSLGVAQDEFREMVTAGEISSDQFLDVMDDFAGEMSEAYANSWSGMVANTKANIGIIGENILGGVFEQSKESIAEFLEYLRSDDVREWAAQTGQQIGQAFANMIESIKNAIEWWGNLDDRTKNIILTIAGIAVAIGPVLLVAGKLIDVVMNVSRWFGLIKVVAGVVSAAIGAISTPVLIVIGVIAGLIGMFTALYHSNEGFRDLVQTVWATIQETISTVVQAVSDFVMGIVGSLVDWWQENNELIRESAQVVWEAIQTVIMNVIDALMPYITTAWEIIKTVTSTVWEIIKTVIETVINTVMGIVKAVMQAITGDWSGAWETIKNTVANILSGAVDIISSLLSGAFDIIKSILGHITDRFTSIFSGLKDIVSNAFGNVISAVSNGMSNAFDAVTGFFSRFKDAGRNIVTSIADGIKGAIGTVTDAIGNVASKVRDFLPFSPAKEGPLKDLDRLNFGGTISMGIEDGENEVQRAMDELLTYDLPKKANYHNPSYNNEANSHQQSQPIILQVDGKTFAQIIGDYTSEEGGNRIRRIERGLA